jgi:hypothetical protein
VSIPDFGSFKRAERAECAGRNPKVGEEIASRRARRSMRPRRGAEAQVRGATE